MSESKKVLHFPTVSQPSIDDVLTLFLKDQQKRLKPRTFNRYEEVIDLLRHCLNGHGYHDLDTSSEVALYEKLLLPEKPRILLYFRSGKDCFLPAQLFELFHDTKSDGFRGVASGCGSSCKKTGEVAEENGYIGKEIADRVTRLAAEAARELPAAGRLARLIYEYAQSHAPRYWTAELDDYFVIDQVHPGILILSGMATSGIVEVRVPKEITDHCQKGWQVNLLLGKTRNGWCILETGNVYPS